MESKYTPAVNIIRDAKNDLHYIVTENAERSAIRIVSDFTKGFHAFSIIGSYGTGKSSFVWALEQTLTGKKNFFNLSLPKGINKVKTINFVGEYASLIHAFNLRFGITEDYDSHQNLFDKIYQEYQAIGKNGLLLIAVDEFGKFLEYAATHSPEKEMYFVQQLAEFVNDPERNILLISTLHQGLDSYALNLSDQQKNEWRKVKGRLQEITFNEPVEQLLELASSHFVELFGERKADKYSEELLTLQKRNRVFSADEKYLSKIGNKLFPLDLFSAYTLTIALQKYGQNERSLFTFLQSANDLGIIDPTSNKRLSIDKIYDYLWNQYYQLLSTKANSDFTHWSSIRNALQRSEVIGEVDPEVIEAIVKTIGLLRIVGSKGAAVNEDFITGYYANTFKKKDIQTALESLEKNKIIRHSKFDDSYKLFEGTDLDIESALLNAESQINDDIDLVAKLQTHFDFPILTAKAHSYRTGTPRLFEYKLSEKPISETPEGEIDGFINLIFNPNQSTEEIIKKTQDEKNAILYCYFKNSDKIRIAIQDIEKTNQVLKNIEGEGDFVAKKELQSILKSNQILLNHYVLDALFQTEQVTWIYKGTELILTNKKLLNRQLSIICDDVYFKTPVINNELFNRHKISTPISAARKNFFNALADNSDKKDLGFDENKFPPEKTIYYTLLEKNGIHVETKSGWTFSRPKKDSAIYDIWEVCEAFLSSSKTDRRKLTELYDILGSAPYKLKQGVLDFWIPTFLLLRRGDYALYSEGNFKPYINAAELYLITRTPQHYEVKSFELNDLRLSFFNKYRVVLEQDDSSNLDVTSFIESIRPILLTFKGLTTYSKRTTKISKEAIELREAIQNAKDPEKTFFDDFPRALGYNADDLLRSSDDFDNYIYKFQNALDEIKNSYNHLLSRIENYITSEIIGRKCEFIEYKKELSKRFDSLKDHQLTQKQKALIQRLNSPLNDRDSWIASIGQSLIGKSLDSIDDKDEDILKDNLKHYVSELDNLLEIDKLKVDSEKEDVFKIDFTSKESGLKPHLVRVPKTKSKELNEKMSSIKKELGKDKNMRIALLAKLLREELDNE